MFDKKQVRQGFMDKFCHRLILPSGKPSPFFLYPISDDEVVELTSEYSDADKPNYIGKVMFANESEWRLWVALRLKYGINYMNPQKYYWDDIEPEPEPTLKEQVLDEVDKIVNYAIETHRLMEHKPAQENIEKNYKKFLSDY